MGKNETMIIAQNWLKSRYEKHHLFTTKLIGKENIIKGLIQALQIELGVISDGFWNDNTTKAFEEVFPNGLIEETETDINSRIINIIYILQLGFYVAREIPAGGIDGYFGESLTTAVKVFQEQAGVKEDGIVRAYLFKAILSTESYRLDEKGDYQIREIQQNLNEKYHNVIGLIPTNGIYDTRTNNALKKIVQIEIDSLEDKELENEAQ